MCLVCFFPRSARSRVYIFGGKAPPCSYPAQLTYLMDLECFFYGVAAASCLLHLNPAGYLYFNYVRRFTDAFTVQEKHLVMAMNTQQRQGQTGDTIIPTPNVITDTSHYDQVYHRDTLRSMQYIRMSGNTAIKRSQFVD